MDISDGLAGDLAKMLGFGRSARIALESVPLSEAAKRACAAEPGLIDAALTGGDDYEILCTVAPDSLDGLTEAAVAAGVPFTAIGTVTAGDGLPRFETSDGTARVFAAGSFSHF